MFNVVSHLGVHASAPEQSVKGRRRARVDRRRSAGATQPGRSDGERNNHTRFPECFERTRPRSVGTISRVMTGRRTRATATPPPPCPANPRPLPDVPIGSPRSFVHWSSDAWDTPESDERVDDTAWDAAAPALLTALTAAPSSSDKAQSSTATSSALRTQTAAPAFPVLMTVAPRRLVTFSAGRPVGVTGGLPAGFLLPFSVDVKQPPRPASGHPHRTLAVRDQLQLGAHHCGWPLRERSGRRYGQ